LDYVERARSMSRSAFIDRYPELFLIGTQRLVAPAGPQQTIRAELVERGGKLAFAEPLPTTPEPRLSPIVRAIVKTQAAFPAMITVGRTPNNDVVLRDVEVSKFHAWFRVGDGKIELVDAGSRNGTFVGVERLPPKEPRLVSTGSLLRFGSLELTLVDAARCWDHATAF
jgi:pSer/pThr/pTyr-binding forkhead associated (FHA) protein